MAELRDMKEIHYDYDMELLGLLREPHTVYQIAKIKKWSYPKAHRIIKEYKKRGIIELDYEEPFWSLPKKYWRLSELGYSIYSIMQKKTIDLVK